MISFNALTTKITHILFLFAFVFMISCKSDKSNLKYSFFVAGHTYGNPMSPQIGLYPKFKEQIKDINQTQGLELGIFTGDVVQKPTNEYWKAALKDMDEFNVPIHIARGNHDGGAIFDSIFKKSYYAFNLHNNLFIILAPASWSIKDQQLDFLDSTLNANKNKVKNTFVFAHELIWWSPEKYPDVKVNFLPHYPGQTNYFEKVHPLFVDYNQPVYLFSGDVGCSIDVSPYAFKTEDNVSFIASGMGNGENDNYILVDIYNNDSVATNVIKF